MPLRHALEPRHESFDSDDARALCAEHGVAVVVADSAGTWPVMRDATSDFRYVRLHCETELYASGCTDESLDRWAQTCRSWLDVGGARGTDGIRWHCPPVDPGGHHERPRPAHAEPEDAVVNREELRAAQTPLKQRYRDDPESALTPVSASATFDAPPTVEVATWAGPVRAGLHRATGGDGSDACSGDMLMEALAACAGVTLHTVAVAFGVDLRDVSVRAESTFDARGTLGIDREVPVGVTSPRVVAEVTTDADDATLERLATATERYCVVGQSLRRPPTFTVSRRVGGPDPTPGTVR